MRHHLTLKLVVSIIAVVLTVACGGTRLTQTQKDKTFKAKPVSNILVIMVAHNAETREKFEKRFVAELQQAGVDAIASSNAISMPRDLQLDKEVILKAVQENGNDAVIITHVLDVNQEEVFNRMAPQVTSYYSYYGYAYHHVHHPQHQTMDTTVRLETNLYDVATEKQIWRGQSKTWNRESVNKIISEVVKTVVNNLQKNKLLAAR
jgi:hypothetical protein